MSKAVKLDEDKDFFLISLNKKYRNLVKKVRDIEDLEEKDPASLKQEQKAKIQTKPSLKESLAEIEKIKGFYLKSFEEKQQEAKVTPGNAPLSNSDSSSQIEKVKTQTTNTFLHLVLLGTYLSTYPESHKSLPLDLNAQTIISFYKKIATFGDFSRKSLSQQAEISHKCVQEYLESQLSADIDHFFNSQEISKLTIESISEPVVPKHETPAPEVVRKEEKPHHEQKVEVAAETYHEEEHHQVKHESEVESKPKHKWEDYEDDRHAPVQKHDNYEREDNRYHHQHHEEQNNYYHNQKHSPYKPHYHQKYNNNYGHEDEEEESHQHGNQHAESHQQHGNQQENEQRPKPEDEGFIEVKSRFRALAPGYNDRPPFERRARGGRRGGRGGRRGGFHEGGPPHGEEDNEEEGERNFYRGRRPRGRGGWNNYNRDDQDNRDKDAAEQQEEVEGGRDREEGDRPRVMRRGGRRGRGGYGPPQDSEDRQDNNEEFNRPRGYRRARRGGFHGEGFRTEEGDEENNGERPYRSRRGRGRGYFGGEDGERRGGRRGGRRGRGYGYGFREEEGQNEVANT